MSTAFLYREDLKEYDFGPGHPFRGERYLLFMKNLQEALPRENNYRILAAEAAVDEDLRLICDQTYIDFCREYFHSARLNEEYDVNYHRFISSDNVPVGIPGKVEEAARLVVGEGKLAADLVWSGQYKKAVCVGGGLHHAKRRFGEGFCIYNDVAFTATYLLEKYRLEKIIVLDTDAHAGNGTSQYFYSEPRVLLIDLHQDPQTIYPGNGFAREIGEGEGKGFTVNIPLPMGAGDASYRLAFEEIVEPIAAEFQPQIIIRNGGSDPHFDDGLTDLGLTAAGFRMVGEKARRLAGLCGDKYIDLIASGYNRKVLPGCWLALLSGSVDLPVNVLEPVPVPARYQHDAVLEETKQVTASVKTYLSDYWKCF